MKAKVPFQTGRSCCFDDRPDMICVSMSSCNQGFAGAVAWSTALTFLSAGLQATVYLNGSGREMILKRERWCRWLKIAFPTLLLLCGLHVVVYWNFQHIWQEVTAMQTWKVCLSWVVWSFIAMQVGACGRLSFNRYLLIDLCCMPVCCTFSLLLDSIESCTLSLA